MPSPVTGTARRGLQVALGVAWLLDGALQFQPFSSARHSAGNLDTSYASVAHRTA
jgi:hypothetical protein